MQKKLPKGRKGRVIPTINVYSYFQALWMSFYSSDLYIDVKQRWRGFGALYLLLVCVVICLPWTAGELVRQYTFYHKVVVPSIKRLPKLEIKQGEVIFHGKMPYIIKGDLKNKPRVIIDTTGEIKTLTGKKFPTAIMLITKNAIISKFPNVPADVQEIDKNTSGVMSSKEFLKLLDSAKIIFMTTLYPTLVATIFTLEFILLVMFAFIAMFFSKMLMKYDLSYKDSIRICCVAATPKLLLLYIIFLMGWQGKYSGIMLFCILFAYYVLAIRANKHATKTLVVS